MLLFIFETSSFYMNSWYVFDTVMVFGSMQHVWLVGWFLFVLCNKRLGREI